MDKRPAVATVQSQAEVGHDVERETSPSRRLLVYPFRRGRWLRIRRRQAPTRSGPAMTETHTLQIRTELPDSLGMWVYDFWRLGFVRRIVISAAFIP
jgi:hypothetical protein